MKRCVLANQLLHCNEYHDNDSRCMEPNIHCSGTFKCSIGDVFGLVNSYGYFITVEFDGNDVKHLMIEYSSRWGNLYTAFDSNKDTSKVIDRVLNNIHTLGYPKLSRLLRTCAYGE